MKIIVDANIVFSGILNTKGKIGDLLINSEKYFEFIAPDFLRLEIQSHYKRLSKISGLAISEVQESERIVCREIKFISEDQISTPTWLKSIKLVEHVDPKDAPYIAFSKNFKCKIWSGDKQLIKGLSKKGFVNFYSTEELFNLRESKRKK